MDDTHVALDRLEARIEDQAARIDALYRLLELRGILPRGVGTGRGDALSDEGSETVDFSGGWEGKRRPAVDRRAHFHVGEATGV